MSNVEKKRKFEREAESVMAYCIYCGSTVGQDSDIHGDLRPVTAVYDCPRCKRNYCNVCSYSDGEQQRCLRCDSVMEKVQ